MPRLTLDVALVVRVACDGRELFTYVHLPDDPASQAPRPYLHPMRALSGEVVSLVRPHDAPWHRGLSFAVPRVGPHDLWGGPGPVADRGSMDHQHFTEIRERTDHVAFGHELVWHGRSRTGLDAGPELVRERRSLRASVPAADAWVLTWESVLTNISGEDLSLAPASGVPVGGAPGAVADPGAGGLFWRGPRSFTGGTLLLPDGAAHRQAHGHAAAWMGFTGRHDETGGASTVVIVDDEENPGHPARWFASAEPFAALGPTPFADGPLELPPDGTRTFRYAVVVGDGIADVASAADLAALGREALAAAAAPPPPPTLGTFLSMTQARQLPEPVTVAAPARVVEAARPRVVEPTPEPVVAPEVPAVPEVAAVAEVAEVAAVAEVARVQPVAQVSSGAEPPAEPATDAEKGALLDADERPDVDTATGGAAAVDQECAQAVEEVAAPETAAEPPGEAPVDTRSVDRPAPDHEWAADVPPESLENPAEAEDLPAAEAVPEPGDGVEVSEPQGSDEVPEPDERDEAVEPDRVPEDAEAPEPSTGGVTPVLPALPPEDEPDEELPSPFDDARPQVPPAPPPFEWAPPFELAPPFEWAPPTPAGTQDEHSDAVEPAAGGTDTAEIALPVAETDPDENGEPETGEPENGEPDGEPEGGEPETGDVGTQIVEPPRVDVAPPPPAPAPTRRSAWARAATPPTVPSPPPAQPGRPSASVAGAPFAPVFIPAEPATPDGDEQPGVEQRSADEARTAAEEPVEDTRPDDAQDVVELPDEDTMPTSVWSWMPPPPSAPSLPDEELRSPAALPPPPPPPVDADAVAAVDWLGDAATATPVARPFWAPVQSDEPEVEPSGEDVVDRAGVRPAEGHGASVGEGLGEPVDDDGDARDDDGDGEDGGDREDGGDGEDGDDRDDGDDRPPSGTPVWSSAPVWSSPAAPELLDEPAPPFWEPFAAAGEPSEEPTDLSAVFPPEHDGADREGPDDGEGRRRPWWSRG